MKTRNSPPLLWLVAVFVTACASTASLTVWAADTKGATSKKAPAARKAEPAVKPADDKRPPLKLNVDTKAINRDAADRVSYAGVIQRTASSVVYVYSTRRVAAPAMNPLLEEQFRRFFNLPNLPRGEDEEQPRSRREKSDKGGSSSRNKRRSAPEQTQQGLGSGVIVSPDGYILTNNHVVEDADDVRVMIGDSNKRYEARVVGRDPQTDLALLKIDATGLTPAVFADSAQVLVGDVVLAIGNPFGVGQSVSRGIVSALSRGLGIGPTFEDFIQTDAAINPGNSGGALLDTDGRVIGINTAILSRSGGFAGLGFAIPSNLVRSVAEQIANKGRVERGFLGVGPQDLSEDLTAQFGADKGALITEVQENSPAAKAGLKAGDVIVKVNAVEIRDARHLLLTISQFAPDTSVTIEYLRDGKTQTAQAKLARRTTEDTATETSIEAKDEGVLNGVGVSDVTDEIRTELQFPARYKGAIITSIDPDSPSARQGLREGDIILELNRKPVTSADEAVKLSEQIKGPVVLVLVWRAGRTQYLTVDESK